ncbi:hypothetical protein CPB84DRAFT_1853613 [Gymnopilus junonius]|uniref:Uncharacterized protein n=1 Tax=Gymnopilus junonius TaxID=109634 RepID=A0A9P5NBW6_GYMJU|nr:hypothetical protein CPB84DRAFT_1853613 [Gymnopilus junonius]
MPFDIAVPVDLAYTTQAVPLIVPALDNSTARVQTRHLAHTPEQAKQVSQLYAESSETRRHFTKGDASSQRQARQLLEQLGLDEESRSSLESHWNVQWSTSWNVEDGDKRRRILFQWYNLAWLLEHAFVVLLFQY